MSAQPIPQAEQHLCRLGAPIIAAPIRHKERASHRGHRALAQNTPRLKLPDHVGDGLGGVVHFDFPVSIMGAF